MNWINIRSFRSSLAGLGCAVLLVGLSPAGLSRSYPPNTATDKKTAIFAGGCYWGVEAIYDHVKGVKSAVSGFAVGGDPPPSVQLRPGHTGYAESVRVTYDPAQISYDQLLELFFTVVHDPTQLDRQGPDVGPQYRSTIFYQDEEQHQKAVAYLAHLDSAKTFPRPLVTEVVPLKSFKEAPADQQDYSEHHPDQPYIKINDAPKVEQLRRDYPALYR